MEVNKSYLKYILALLMFGSNGVISRLITLNSYEIVFMRTFIGSILLIIIYKVSGGTLDFLKHKKDFFFVILSGMAMGSGWMFLYEAYTSIGVGISSLLYYCGPVIVMALSPALFKEKLTYTKITGFVTVVIGLFLVNGKAVTSGGNVWGYFCGVMSAVLLCILIILNKKADKIAGLQNSMIQLTSSFLTVAVCVLFKQGMQIDLAGVNWWAFLVLGLLNTGIGCYLYFSSIPELPVQSVAVLGYLEPMSAVIFSAVFLAEKMTLAQTIGAICIIGGAMFGELAKPKVK